MGKGLSIRKVSGATRSWYYIKGEEDPHLECAVDYFNMSIPEERNLASLRNEHICSGKLLGVRIEGYAVFVYLRKGAIPDSVLKGPNWLDGSLIPEISALAFRFYKEIIIPQHYRFYDSIVDEATFDPGLYQTPSEAPKSQKEYVMTIEKPEPRTVENVLYKFDCPVNDVNSSKFRICAINSDGTLLTTRIRSFFSDNLQDRKQMRRIIDKYKEGKRLVAKVDGYQILIEEVSRDDSKLSSEDALIILNRIADFFSEDYLRKLWHNERCRDLSEEKYHQLYDARDKERAKKTKREIVISSVVLSIVLALAISGYLFSLFGIAMFIAYADDLFARRK